MGTHFVMFVKEGENGDEKPIGGLYGQFDGYPEGYPHDLLSYIAKKKIVNGIRVEEFFDVINGPEDLVAHLLTLAKILTSVSHMGVVKKAPVDKIEYGEDFPIVAGTFYVENSDPEADPEILKWEDYVYIIVVPPLKDDWGKPRPEVEGAKLKLRVYHFGKKVYDGTIGGFLKKIEGKTGG